MDRNRTCSFIGCSNTSINKNCTFYEFPEDFNLCIQWVEIIGCQDFFEDFAFHGTEPFRGRFICSDHFTEEDIIDTNDILSGLKNGAVPFYYIPNRKPEGMGNIKVKKEPIEGDSWDTNDSKTIFPVNILDNVMAEDVSSQFISSGDASQANIFNFNMKNKNIGRRCVHKTNEQLAERRIQHAQRASLRRKLETPEETEMRRKANAERQAKRRSMETEEEREIRRVKDLLRARRRRDQETEEQRRQRRRFDAERAQVRRNNETEEEKMSRRMSDLKRVTNKRRNETDEERSERLKKNREYSAKRRYVQKLELELGHPKNVSGDNYLSLGNVDRDVNALSSSFFHSLASYSEQQFNNLEKNQENRQIGDNLIIPNSVHLNDLGYSHFLLNSSLVSRSFDATSETMRFSSNDSSDNQMDHLLPSGVFQNHTSVKSFLQT